AARSALAGRRVVRLDAAERDQGGSLVASLLREMAALTGDESTVAPAVESIPAAAAGDAGLDATAAMVLERLRAVRGGDGLLFLIDHAERLGRAERGLLRRLALD